MASPEKDPPGKAVGIDRQQRVTDEQPSPDLQSGNEASGGDGKPTRSVVADNTADNPALQQHEAAAVGVAKDRPDRADQPQSQGERDTLGNNRDGSKNPPGQSQRSAAETPAARSSAIAPAGQQTASTTADDSSAAQSAHAWVSLPYPVSWGPAAPQQDVTPEALRQTFQQTSAARSNTGQNPESAVNQGQLYNPPASNHTALTEAEKLRQQAAEQARIDTVNNGYFTSNWFTLSLGDMREMNIESVQEAGDSVWKNMRFAAEEKATKPKDSQ